MPERPAARIAVLVSGQGRNLQALIEACASHRIHGSIVGVLSNRAQAPALSRAQAADIPALAVPHAHYPERAAFDAALSAALEDLRADVIVLAGFMRVLGPAFVQRHAGRLINIHPSLLPRYPGLNTHQRALEAGDREHGATVHFVTEALDGGPPVIQGGVSVRPEDTVDSLGDRVMTEVEIRILPQSVAWMANGALVLRGAHAELHGRVLLAPLQMADLDEAFR